MTSSRLILSTLGLLALAVLSGRTVVGAIKARVLLRFDPTAAAASALLGIASWTLGFGWLTAMGVRAPPIAGLLFASLLGALAVCWGRGTLGALRPVGSSVAWLALLAVWGIGLIVAMLPVLRMGSFDPCNDTYHYVAFSEWLQRSSWGTPTPWDPLSPVTYIPSMFQRVGYPLGAAYLLALAQAVLFPLSSLALYPAVAALGILLNAGAQYVVGRWVFRLSEGWAAAGSLAFAVVPHSTYWAHHSGFLQQTYGIAVLLLAVALLTRATRPADVATTVLVALLAAYLLLVYLPMVPPLVIGLLPWAWISFRRAVRRHVLSRWSWTLATCSLVFVGVAYPELRGLWLRLLSFAESRAGGHISFGAWDYVSFAVGSKLEARDWGPGVVLFLRTAHAYLTPVYVALMGWGVRLALRRPRTWTLLGALAYLLSAALYYGLFARDPWSGEAGHTWNLFKLSQYAFPLLFPFLFFALRSLLRQLPLLPMAAPAGGALLLAGMVPIQWAWSAEAGRAMGAILPAARPLEALPDLRRRFSALPEGTLYVLGRPAVLHACLGDVLALTAYPRPIVSDWNGTYHVLPIPDAPASIRRLLANPGPPRVLTLLVGEPPFSSEGTERLGPGVTWLSQADPRVLRIEEHGGTRELRSEGSIEWTGQSRLRIVVYSPRATRATLELDVRPRLGVAGTPLDRVLVGMAPGELRGPALRRALESTSRQEVVVDGSGKLSFPVRLEEGKTTVALERLSTSVPSRANTVPLTILRARVIDLP